MASLAELLRNTPGYEEHYDWFIELAKNFHQIQMEMVKPRSDFAVICHGNIDIGIYIGKVWGRTPTPKSFMKLITSSFIIPRKT